jgi:hypothetical protein
VGGRLLRYVSHASRASAWIEGAARKAVTRNMVFPGGGEIVVPMTMAAEHADMAAGMPALVKASRAVEDAVSGPQEGAAVATMAAGGVRGAMSIGAESLTGAVQPPPGSGAAVAAVAGEGDGTGTPSDAGGSPMSGFQSTGWEERSSREGASPRGGS